MSSAFSQTVKTATSTPSSVGTKANRSHLSIRNESDCLRVRVGNASITQNAGKVIEPGGELELAMTASSSGTEVYVVSEGAAVQCSLFEIFQS